MRTPWIARIKSGAIAAFGHLILALVVTFPMFGSLASRLVGDPRVDVWNHAWGWWWFLDAAQHGYAPLSTHLLAAPTGGKLWFIDPIGAGLGMGLVPIVGLVAAWNLTVLGLVALASASGRSLALALGAGARASWMGAVGVAASAHVISEVHNGISEAVGVCWAIFAMGALFRALRRPRHLSRWLALGVLGGVTVLGTFYYAFSLALFAVPVLGAALVRGARGPILRGVFAAAIPAAMVAVPVFMLVHGTIEDPATAIIPRQDGDWHARFWMLEHNAVDIQSFFRPGEFQSVDLGKYGESFRHSSYLGWLALVPACLSRRRILILAAAVPLAFSLGPFLWFDAGWVKLGSGLVALPFRALIEVVPAGAIGHPQRIGLCGMALIPALAATSLGKRSAPWVTAGLLAELLLLSPAPWPVALAPSLDTRYAEFIAKEAERYTGTYHPAVLDLPAELPGEGMTTSRYLVYQAWHHQPIPFGPNVRKDAFRMSRNRGASAIVRENAEQMAEVGASDFARGDLGWVVLHTDLGDTSTTEAWLREKLGAPEQFGPALVWDVMPTRSGVIVPYQADEHPANAPPPFLPMGGLPPPHR